MTSPFRINLCLLLLTFGAGSLSAQESATDAFANGVDLLLSGQIDSLPIDNLGAIRAVQFDLEGWDFFNEHEKKSTTDGSLPLKRFRPITQSDILQVADDHWVFLLHEKQGFKIHLASVTSQGVPIESFLLHDHYGYLYEKTFRAFSYTQPVHYNQEEGAFEFYQLTYGYERNPTLDHPTQDPIYHQSFHRVGVNGQGQMELLLSEPTGNQIFRREYVELVSHEVAFQDFSLFAVSEKDQPQSAIWQAGFVTHGDMDSHDSITIQLEFEAPWANRFFFLHPAEGTTIVEVSQRHENILSFPGDGSTCSLTRWRRFRSTWRDLHCEDNFFQTVALDEREKRRFSEYTQAELAQAFEEACGDVHDMASQSLVMEPSPSYVQVVVDQIVLKIVFLNASGRQEKFILLQLAGGC